jgi:hypothetical protein
VHPRIVSDGLRPERPDRCPNAVFQLMSQCWSPRPADRPSFASLKMHIQDAYAAEVAAQAAREHDEQNLCIICLERSAEFALLPCGHKCVCEEHAAAVFRLGECPLCRNSVTSFNKIF